MMGQTKAKAIVSDTLKDNDKKCTSNRERILKSMINNADIPKKYIIQTLDELMEWIKDEKIVYPRIHVYKSGKLSVYIYTWISLEYLDRLGFIFRVERHSDKKIFNLFPEHSIIEIEKLLRTKHDRSRELFRSSTPKQLLNDFKQLSSWFDKDFTDGVFEKIRNGITTIIESYVKVQCSKMTDAYIQIAFGYWYQFLFVSEINAFINQIHEEKMTPIQIFFLNEVHALILDHVSVNGIKASHSMLFNPIFIALFDGKYNKLKESHSIIWDDETVQRIRSWYTEKIDWHDLKLFKHTLDDFEHLLDMKWLKKTQISIMESMQKLRMEALDENTEFMIRCMEDYSDNAIIDLFHSFSLEFLTSRCELHPKLTKLSL